MINMNLCQLKKKNGIHNSKTKCKEVLLDIISNSIYDFTMVMSYTCQS